MVARINYLPLSFYYGMIIMVIYMEYASRKSNRLKAYDYSSTGIYFITICTSKRNLYFWEDNIKITSYEQKIPLSRYGNIVDSAIKNIPIIYPEICVEKYVIMPNHIHILLRIYSYDAGRPMVAPTISRVVNQTKGFVSKQIGYPIWQKSFYDHIIRNEKDYLEKRKYIENNPINWEKDDFFI